MALLSEGGTVLGSVARAYDVVSPHAGWAEIDPLTWQQATGDAVRAVLESTPHTDVVGIGLDGQMHGVVLVDQDGQPTRPAVLWPDGRAVSQADRLSQLGPESLASLANPVTPGMAGPMLAWLAENEADVVQGSSSFVLPKDWVRSLLTGWRPATDPSDASATLLWDVATDDWATTVAGASGVPTRLFPTVHASADASGDTGATARTWGLRTHVPVSFGCSDVAATLLGLEAEPGRTMITIGTGAQVVLPGVAPEKSFPPSHHLYRDAGDGWYAMVAVTNAGLALQRVLTLLNADWDELYAPYERAGEIPGFLPFFTGERLPVRLSGGQAGWFDVGLSAGREHLLAAALEGVAFAIRHAVDVMPSASTEIDLAGGGTRSPVFAQLLADVLGRPLRRVPNRDATVVGAARLGWKAAGLEAPSTGSAPDEIIEPCTSPQLEARYARFINALTTRLG